MYHEIKLEKNYLYVEFVGDSDEKVAEEFKEEFERQLNSRPNDFFDVIVNMGQAGSANAKALKIYAKAMQHKHLKKIAFYKAGPMQTAFVNIAVNISKKDNIHFFDTLEKAQAWLKEK